MQDSEAKVRGTTFQDNSVRGGENRGKVRNSHALSCLALFGYVTLPCLEVVRFPRSPIYERSLLLYLGS